MEIDWFNNSSDEMEYAQAKAMAWNFLRLHDQGEERSVPGWRALNEATSSVDSSVTIAGMLPILQAPADHNDTLTTVVNRFMDISKYTGQKHRIITADQPLYIRGKELVWAN